MVYSEAFTVKKKNASQSKQNLTLFIVVVCYKLLIVNIVFICGIFLVKLKASLQSAINNLSYKTSVGNKIFVIESYLIKEISSSDFFAEMRDGIKNIIHQFLFSVKIVEAKKSEILIDCEKNLSVNFIDRFLTHESNIASQRKINSFSNVHILEQSIIFLFFSKITEDVIVIKHPVLDQHQSFNIFQVDSFLQGSR